MFSIDEQDVLGVLKEFFPIYLFYLLMNLNEKKIFIENKILIEGFFFFF